MNLYQRQHLCRLNHIQADTDRLGEGFLGVKRYFEDAAYRAEIDAEVAGNRARMHAAIDAGMAPLNQRQQARWAAEALLTDNQGEE